MTKEETNYADSTRSIKAAGLKKEEDSNDANPHIEKPTVIEVGGRKVSRDELLVSLKKAKPSLSADASRRKLNLGDVISSGPVEQEAETHILRAVDKLKDDSAAGEEKELGKLYDDIAVEEFSTPPNSDNSKNVAAGSTPVETKTRPSGLASVGSQDSGSVAVNLKQRGRFKQLVKKHMASKNVEQNLFGLSSALSQMKEEHSKDENANSPEGAGDAKGSAVPRIFDLESQIPEETEPENTDGGSDEDASKPVASRKSKKGSSGNNRHGFFHDRVVDGRQLFKHFLDPRKEMFKAYLRKTIMFVMIPSLVIAVILFYFVENPSLCEKKVPEDELVSLEPRIEPVYDVNGTLVGNVTVVPEEPEKELFVCPGLGASVSWWFLFVVRQTVTLTMALITQSFVVDFLALSTRACLKWTGPVFTLLLVQAKGWPFILTFWAAYDLLLNAGTSDFVHHWAYFQDWISLFTDENPSGNVVDHPWNLKVLRLCVFIGVAVSLKRLVLSLFLGRQTFARYGEQLAEVMSGMVLLGEVATLAKDIQKFSGEYANKAPDLAGSQESERRSTMQGLWNNQPKDVDGSSGAELPSVTAAEAANAFIQNRNSPPILEKPTLHSATTTTADVEFSASQRQHLSDLLEAWEEPQTAEQKEQKKITIGAVLQFRQALAFMNVRYPFLPAFGLADTREHCIQSAQEVYDRLMLRTPNEVLLPFDTLALLAKDENDEIDLEKAKLMIKSFRPDRDGYLSKLDFVKSCDTIYKSIRLLIANINNSSQIDSAVEGIFNAVFYLVIASVSSAFLGVNPLQLFLSFSSFLLVFAFAFGNSSSKYFEGALFILAQSPYGVGDRIHLSHPNQETNIDGSAGWIVEQITLYTTSLYWVATNERATIANGAISNMRVINAARSPNAQIFVNMKFAIDTPHEKVDIFKAAIEQFLKDRPREWLAFVGFRPTEVAVERGYINFVTIAQHRSSWQDLGSVLVSKAELVTYELEVAKKLEMTYHQPHLPVDLNVNQQVGEIGPQNGMPNETQSQPQDANEMAPLLNQSSLPIRPGMLGQTRAFAVGGGDE